MKQREIRDHESSDFYLCLDKEEEPNQIAYIGLHIYHKPERKRNMSYPANSAEITNITIGEPWRGEGRESELLDIVVQYAESRGATKIFATDTNVENRPLLKEKGFSTTGDEGVWYRSHLS